MSWTLYEKHHKKVIKIFEDPIKAAEHCSNWAEMKKIASGLWTYLEFEETSWPADIYLKDDKHNWGFSFSDLLEGHWFETGASESEWIEPELQHRMFEILNHMEPTEFVPLNERPDIAPDTYEYPF